MNLIPHNDDIRPADSYSFKPWNTFYFPTPVKHNIFVRFFTCKWKKKHLCNTVEIQGIFY